MSCQHQPKEQFSFGILDLKCLMLLCCPQRYRSSAVHQTKFCRYLHVSLDGIQNFLHSFHFLIKLFLQTSTIDVHYIDLDIVIASPYIAIASLYESQNFLINFFIVFISFKFCFYNSSHLMDSILIMQLSSNRFLLFSLISS